MKMKHIHDMVEVALMKNSATRDDDFILYATICADINPLSTSMDMVTLMMNHERFGLPAFESISRARRKVQNENPALRPSANASDFRYKKWKEVREWAIQ